MNLYQATTTSGFCKEKESHKHMELLGIGLAKNGPRLEDVDPIPASESKGGSAPV